MTEPDAIEARAEREADRARTLVQEAAERSDMIALRTQAQKAIDERVAIAKALDGLMLLYGPNKKALPEPSEHVVGSLERVALAAIELARFVVEKQAE